jgi:hypothetical protein
VKNFARVGSSAQTGQSVSAGNNPDKAVATFPSRAIGFENGNLNMRAGAKPGPHLGKNEMTDMALMFFDSSCPQVSGSLAGDALAATLESHPRYPFLSGALFERVDEIVVDHLDYLADLLLPGLGFDESGVEAYLAAALTAFRAARPDQPQNRSRH